MNRRIALYFPAAWVLILIASISPHLLARVGLQPWLDSVPWLGHFVVKTVLIGLAFAAMAYEGQPLAAFGFRRSFPPGAAPYSWPASARVCWQAYSSWSLRRAE